MQIKTNEELVKELQELQWKYDLLNKKYHTEITNYAEILHDLEMLNSLNADLNRGYSLEYLLNKSRQIIINSFPVSYVDIYLASDDGQYLLYKKEEIKKEYLAFFEKMFPFVIPNKIKISLLTQNWYASVMSGSEMKITSSISDIESMIMAFIEGNYQSFPLKKYFSKIIAFFKDKCIIASVPLIFDKKKIALLDINFKTQPTAQDINRIQAFVEQLVIILHHKQAELTIIQQNQELVKIDKDKDRFLSVLGHDLRNSFNSLLGLSRLLLKNIRKYDIDNIEFFINQINQSTQRAYNLLDDLLIWARSKSGAISFQPQKLNLKDLCVETLDLLEPIAYNKKININLTIANDIYVFADSNMLKILLRNLISNAIKFTYSGGKIDVLSKQNQKNMIITISDNGIGIAPEILETIFENVKIYSTKGTADEEGTGLGLLLCKEIIEKHKGKIWVESELGKGSSFKFSLPLFEEI